MSDTLTLIALSASAAVLHTLIPDHEIPLAMIGRTQNWTHKTMTFWTLIAGVIHVLISMVIGVIAVFVSLTLAQYVANAAHLLSGVFLITFGAVYVFLAWKGKHAHSHRHNHMHEPETHVDSKGNLLIRNRNASMIAGIVGIAPCFTLIPVLVAAQYRVEALVWVMLTYAVATIGTMIVLTNIALKAITYVTRLKRIEKYVEILAGAVIFSVGLYLMSEYFLPRLQ